MTDEAPTVDALVREIGRGSTYELSGASGFTVDGGVWTPAETHTATVRDRSGVKAAFTATTAPEALAGALRAVRAAVGDG